MLKLVVALLALACVASAVSGPALVLRKKLLENPVYVSREVTVVFRIYNVGDRPAYDVELKEPGFKEELFTTVIGSEKATWKSIAPGTNVSHTMVLKPKSATREAFYGYPAFVSYLSAPGGDEKFTAYSNDIGAFHVYQRGELTKKVSASPLSWALVLATIAIATVGPLTFWRSIQSRLPNGLPRGLKRVK